MEILGGGNVDEVKFTEESNEEEYSTIDLIESAE